MQPAPYIFGKCAAWNLCGMRFAGERGLGVGLVRAAADYSSWVSKEVNTLIFFVFLDMKYNPHPTFFFFFYILRRMGKNKALAHHTSTYFHTRRVSI